MTTIAIVPDKPGASGTTYRALTGKIQSVGRTAGEALDALTSQLGDAETSTLVVVQQLRPDDFFTAQQQRRLEELIGALAWRARLRYSVAAGRRSGVGGSHRSRMARGD